MQEHFTFVLLPLSPFELGDVTIRSESSHASEDGFEKIRHACGPTVVCGRVVEMRKI